ncbi:MAG: endonuclease/exonuclease/phosphatase family protein [Phycisphaerae bacterium]|nr:endonuclease/exonuclease/phosphatase family protein [Phycisphaerae bacterium]
MAKAFSVASWNVEHFKGDPARSGRVISFLKAQSPDVFALYEVEGSESFNALVAGMPGYTFHITEGQQVQEILVGVRHGLTAFFTQKTEFRSGVTAMRPGALLTLTVDGKHYSLLFLHTASMNDPRGLGLRDDMLLRACEFRKTLNKAAGGCANYLFMGDFNTMGMKYKYVKGRNIAPTDELAKLTKEAEKMKMKMLTKDGPETWSNGSKSSLQPANLDHVVAANHLSFAAFGGAEVTLRGWPKESSTAKQDTWIKDYSDHALMYFEVQKVS